MGCCKDCRHVYVNDGRIINKYECLLLNSYVQPYASCNNFSAKMTKSNSGYTGSSSGSSSCFLTSACVDYLGKEDNCTELETLRCFRDSYVKSTEDGCELVKNYYEIAPKIVDKINESPEKEIHYKAIYSTVVKCVNLINRNENESALEEYKKLVEKLSKELL